MPVVHKTPTVKIERDPCESNIVSVKDLSFSYPGGHTALREVSLEIQDCEKVALVGPNGAGKSTLMLHLNGILSGQGDIAIAGVTLEKPNLPFIRSMVGMVFQNPDDQLFSPTVFDDVAFGPLHMGYLEEDVHARVNRALDQVDMKAYAHRLSHHLSVGEKKRISIATVLSMEPELLVLDEPTAGLDPRARRSLIKLLDQMEHTILVSTHDIRMVDELFPRTVVMDAGSIVADGPTSEILRNEDLLEKHGLEKP
jgi:cobalt/nickel transport system ATP-binding protein